MGGSWKSFLSVRDGGELNRATLLVARRGRGGLIDVRRLEALLSDAAVKGQIVAASELIGASVALGLLEVTSLGGVRLTEFGRAFRRRGEGSMFELSEGQQDLLADFLLFSPGTARGPSDQLARSMAYSPRARRYQRSIIDEGPPQIEDGFLDACQACGLVSGDRDGVIFVVRRQTERMAKKVRVLRHLNAAGSEPTEEQLALAEWAETEVVRLERQRLTRMRRPDLAGMVERVSDYDSSLGYDVVSYQRAVSRPEAPDRFIEVKSSSLPGLQLVMTRNELETARKLRREYWVLFVGGARLGRRVSPSSVRELRNPAATFFDTSRFLISADQLEVREIVGGRGG